MFVFVLYLDIVFIHILYQDFRNLFLSCDLAVTKTFTLAQTGNEAVSIEEIVNFTVVICM